MTTLDRYILRLLLTNYAIALAIMMSLYIVLDLFVNIDEFTEMGAPSLVVARNIASYYGVHSFLYFSQLSGVITLFACLATLARMRRSNELTAMLASGVSLYRVAVPVVAFGLASSVLWYVDVEFVIPRVAHYLARAHEDAGGTRSRDIWFVKVNETDLLSAMQFTPAQREMRHMLVLERSPEGAAVSVIEADRAAWEPLAGHPAGGRWRLERGIRRFRVVEDNGLGPRDTMQSEPIDTYESPLDPATLEVRQAQQWLSFASSARLAELAQQDPSLANRVRRIKHGRFAAPLVHVLMLLLGLPIFLSREPANVFADAGKCVVVCGLCFVLAFSSENFVVTSTLSALPAWLPIIVFSPIAVVLFDRMRT
jgi:lipopolysaccharide export LptBFGC system permease protein LptF